MIVLFFKETLVTGVTPTEPNNTTEGEVVLVFVIDKLRVVVLLLEPLILIYFPVILMRALLAREPEMVAFTALAGWMVSVLVALA